MNAYDKIGSVVETWCEKNGYQPMLVTISIGFEWEKPHLETQLLDFDCVNLRMVWDMDWWEGQPIVELVGFAPLYSLLLHGKPGSLTVEVEE